MNIGETYNGKIKIEIPDIIIANMSSFQAVAATYQAQLNSFKALANQVLAPIDSSVIKSYFEISKEITEPLFTMAATLTSQQRSVIELAQKMTESLTSVVTISIPTETFNDEAEYQQEKEIHVEFPDASEPIEDLIKENSRNFELSWQEIYEYMVIFFETHPILAFFIRMHIESYLPGITEAIFFWVVRHFKELITFILSLIGD